MTIMTFNIVRDAFTLPPAMAGLPEDLQRDLDRANHTARRAERRALKAQKKARRKADPQPLRTRATSLAATARKMTGKPAKPARPSRQPIRRTRTSDAVILGRLAVLIGLLAMLGGCNALTRISEIGEEPKISKIENPTHRPDYQPVSMPMPKPEVATINRNSLWRAGARGFFKDQRAQREGDILTVRVNIEDGALLENDTTSGRDDVDSADISALGGLETYANDFLPEAVNPGNLLSTNTDRTTSGTGEIDRSEEINITMAAIVVQVLPNGNLVIAGQQEVRVNFELRQLMVSGVIRRSDIGNDNSISSDQIAELRIAYGGRGTLSDVQTPRYGRQLLDVIMPF